MLSLSSPVSTSTRSQWGELFFLMALSLSRSYVHTLTHTHARTQAHSTDHTHAPTRTHFHSVPAQKNFPPKLFPIFQGCFWNVLSKVERILLVPATFIQMTSCLNGSNRDVCSHKNLSHWTFYGGRMSSNKCLLMRLATCNHHYVLLTNGHRCRQRRRRCQRRRCRENVVVFFVDGGKKLRRHCRNEWMQHIRSTTCSPCHNDGDDSTKISNL